MGHAERAEVEYPGILYQFLIHFLCREQHVRSGIPEEREIPVTILKGLYKSEGCPCIFVHNKIGGIDPHLLQGRLQLQTEDILSHFTDESGRMSAFVQHSQDIAGRSSRICFKKSISLCAFSIICKVN